MSCLEETEQVQQGQVREPVAVWEWVAGKVALVWVALVWAPAAVVYARAAERRLHTKVSIMFL